VRDWSYYSLTACGNTSFKTN